MNSGNPMDKNTILAVALSMLVLIGWYFIFPPPPPQEQDPSAQQTDTATSTSPSEATTRYDSGSEGMSGQFESAEAPDYEEESDFATRQNVYIETDRYKAVIDTRGGVMTEFSLKQYDHSKEHISVLKLIPSLGELFGMKQSQPEVTKDNHVEMIKNHLKDIRTFDVVFEENSELSNRFKNSVFRSDSDQLDLTGTDAARTLQLRSPKRDGVVLIKSWTFYPDSYLVDYNLQVVNYSPTILPLKVRHQLGEGRVLDREAGIQSYSHVGPVYYFDEDVEPVDTDDLETELAVHNLSWLGIEDEYFITAAAPMSTIRNGFFSAGESFKRNERTLEPYFGIRLPPTDLMPNKQIESKLALYFGPKHVEEMHKFGRNLHESLDMRLEILADPLLRLLRYIYTYVGNWGVAIICLTIIVRLVLFPLTYKGTKSMRKMQQLGPKMKKIREKFKNDKEKMNMEVMELYKKHKVNPVGGCLPMLLQIPIFFALYSALSTAVELRHAEFFGWITDLSAPDGLGITPLLMGATMYFLQKLQPNAMMDPMQQKIMSMLPIIFTVFTFAFPSGLTVYWVTSNVLSIGQQVLLNRIPTPEGE